MALHEKNALQFKVEDSSAKLQDMLWHVPANEVFDMKILDKHGLKVHTHKMDKDAQSEVIFKNSILLCKFDYATLNCSNYLGNYVKYYELPTDFARRKDK